MWTIGCNSTAGNYEIAYYNSASSNFTTISGGAVAIAVDSNGLPWVYNSGGAVWRFTGTKSAGTWEQLPGCLKGIAIGGDDTVWGLGCALNSGGWQIFTYSINSNTWTNIPGGGMTIAVDPNGLAWVTHEDNTIWRYVSSSAGWEQVAGCATDIAIGSDGTVSIIGCSAGTQGDRVQVYNSATSTWANTTRDAVEIAVSPTGYPWIINNSSSIFQGTCTY